MDEIAAPELTEREKVERLEAVLQQFPQVECPVSHHFGPGVYMRTMLVPAGTIATGAVHKTAHTTIIAGHCLLTTSDGPREFLGYHVIDSLPGAKRAITAIETTVVTTVHLNPDDERDLDKLVARLTDTPAAQLLGGSNNRQAQIQREKQEALQ